MTSKKNSWNLICAGLTACFSFCMQFGFSQVVQTITDRKDILIGEQIKLTIKATVPTSATLNNWAKFPDSIPHFDIVEAARPDTSDFKDNSKVIEQTIMITSFDSGRWLFPAMPVQFAGAAGQPPRILQTDSFYVNVGYSPADSTNELRDIKPIINVSVIDYRIYFIIGGIVLALLIIYLLYRYFKKHKKEKPLVSKSILSPFDEAMTELKKLGELNLNDASETKIYHTKLSYIFKNYLGRIQGKGLLDNTTADLLINIRELNVQAEDLFKLATALRYTDAVKFAKFQPSATESEDSLQKIKETIHLIEQQPQTTNPKP